MKALYTVLLLVCSNTFMTIAWYGHLKFNGSNNGSPLPLLFAFGCRVSIYHPFAAFVSYLFANVILIIGDKNTLAMASIFRIQLHGSMKGRSAASKEIEDSRCLI